jgi:hypothetical protein
MKAWHPGDTPPLPGDAYTGARGALKGFIVRRFGEMAVTASLDDDTVTSQWKGDTLPLDTTPDPLRDTGVLVTVQTRLLTGKTEASVVISGALKAERTYSIGRSRRQRPGDYDHATALSDACVGFVLSHDSRLLPSLADEAVQEGNE